MTVQVQVNGQWRDFPDGSAVTEVLRVLGAERRGIAVALDGMVVRRQDWAGTVVAAGARMDILTAVQGG